MIFSVPKFPKKLQKIKKKKKKILFGRLQQSFPEGIIKPHEGTSLTIGKVCRRPICNRISSHFGQTGETLISGLRRKNIILTILRALMWGVTSLWLQKARAKLKLISDQARDLVKNCIEGRPLRVPFKTAHLHPGS